MTNKIDEQHKTFTHLHLHTEYSLLDGVGKLDDYLSRAKELGMTSISITDHGCMFGAFEFYKKAMKKGIKPIVGMESYITSAKTAESRDREDTTFHLILLSKNETGYKNLLKLSSYGYLKGFYYKPRIDKAFLKEHSDGIIALSACMRGEVPYYLGKENDDQAQKSLDEYIEIFGKENFYIELQDNGVSGQKELNKKLYAIAKKNDLKVVATNDVHYVYHGDDVLQDILLCLSTGSKMDDEKRMKIDTAELYLKSREQMLEIFSEYPEAVDNTMEVAAKCNLVLDVGGFKFPHYKIPENEESIESYLRTLVINGYEKRYAKLLNGNITEAVQIQLDEVKERIAYELDVINKMGYAGYFVVVWDFIHYARSVNIPVGPGRGSAAGSMIAYLLEITELDPIKYNLIFERFLNPERISMPDIDIDICQERRQEVIDYVTQKYGKERVAQIITFGTMKARAAIRDVGRVMNIPLPKVDKVAKLITTETIDEALKVIPELRELYQQDSELQKMIDYSRRMEGKVRHASVHAAGVVIAKDPLEECVPLYSDSKVSVVTTQYQMKELEEMGLIKMDFLGLRNLTILQRALEYIEQSRGEKIILGDIPLDSEKAYAMLRKGDTSGVFQLESDGIRRLIIKMGPDRFEDIIAILALYRPGPLGSGMVDDFINGKQGKGTIKYPHPLLEDVLKETYGVILYQEQVMKIASILADYSLGEADLLRRAMGKKITEIMDENRNKFVDRADKKGINRNTAEDIFNLIAKFADYGFNKSHSAAYALVSYWTAYFKANYPVEFSAALMTSETNDIDKLALYIDEAKQHGVEVMRPDVNYSSAVFTVKENKIVFGMSAIKNVGDHVVNEIIREREFKGKFKSYEDFVYRTKKVGLTRKTMEAFIYSGSLDSIEGTRKEKFEAIDTILDYASKKINRENSNQLALFDIGATTPEYRMPKLGEFNQDEILRGEKEFVGLYFSGHPMDKYKHMLNAFKVDSIKNILESDNKRKAKLTGIIRDLKKKITKAGEVMAEFVLEDYYGKIKVMVFPRTFMSYSHYLTENNIVYIEGNINIDSFGDVEEKKISLLDIKGIEEIEEVRNLTVYILLEEETKFKMDTVKEIILNHTGKDIVNLALRVDGKKSIVKLGERYKVNPSDKFIEEIEKLLGKDTVAIK